MRLARDPAPVDNNESKADGDVQIPAEAEPSDAREEPSEPAA